MDKEERKIKNNIKSYLFFGFLLLILIPIIYLFFPVYKSLNPECEYREKILTVPEQFIGAKIIFEREYAVFKNEYDGKCVPILNSIKYWVAEARAYPDEKKKINIGTNMYIKQVIAETRYGVLNTIDSGKGPWFKFIVEDENGDTYLLSNYDLEDSRYVSIYKDNEKVFPLDKNYLESLFTTSK